ncbi:MAG: FAD-binding dehydrogenase [Cryobacterium sp.]|nr:FAD-binding dehydrogenase [Cryobacterium sp.]MBX3088064.1 FAD-binding dehydrogenase [Cryobacterium sp.]MBX3089105.1 FAD-binding dehydrogenase [Cryobacterium sp.]MBX3117254.1 FAD-binding dehydrogenase [Cryobacterium sp.]MCW5944856.1 FAD-binding dehydrogenase [Cryobacterium sp.]
MEAADAIVVGAGLAGLVATCELIDAGRKVIILDQEPETGLGGQAWWSFGGLFLIDSPEQRRMGIRDSLELARQDWEGAAGFDRDVDNWPRQWAEAYLNFAATEKRDWLHKMGVRFFPVVGWAERGGYTATGHGNSVPRFHITWGTGPGLLEPFVSKVLAARSEGKVELRFRHRVDELLTEGGAVVGAKGSVLKVDSAARGEETNREVVDRFELRSKAVIVASGGIGGNQTLVRKNWPTRFGKPPKSMLTGVPAHVDGRMLEISQKAGANLINTDRMWHYVEGIKNFAPVWPDHGIRILPGPSSIWLDPTGKRLPVPLFPGFDSLGTLEYLNSNGFDYSWFILTQAIIEKEFALSGSEQNPDLTGKSISELLRQRLGKGATEPVEAFKEKGEDFIVGTSLDEILAKMQDASPDYKIDAAQVRKEIEARDRELKNKFAKDAQVNALRQARNYRGDKLIRVASPHRILDPKAGPLIAVKLHILTRKTLGGIETNLDAQALDKSGKPVPGLYAAGEVSGFGGGGVHGYRSLEGTFLGGCMFSGRQAGRGVAAALS